MKDIYDMEEEIIDMLNNSFGDKKELLEIEKKILATKGELEILLGGNYKNTPYSNKLLLHISDNNILLNQIVSQNNADIYLLLLIKISIENGLTISGKAEPFIHRKILSGEKYERRRKLLRQYYESFLFKSLGKTEFDRYRIKFDFNSLSDEELKVLRNRIKYYLKNGKYPKIF